VKHGFRGILVGLAAVLLLAACGGERASQVTLAQLAGAAAEFNGELVETEGVVRRFDDPLHYWLEDEDINRVAVSPESVVEGHLGETLRVVGRFTYHPERGRKIELDPAATAGANVSVH